MDGGREREVAPHLQAMCREFQPSLFLMSGLLPACTSALMISTLSLVQANIRGVLCEEIIVKAMPEYGHEEFRVFVYWFIFRSEIGFSVFALVILIHTNYSESNCTILN